MEPAGPPEITRLLDRWSNGDEEALAELTPLVYEELRHLAHRYLSGEQQQTLNTTALAHEAWMRLTKLQDPHWSGRTHFFALCARLIRRILVDHARARLTARRGGGSQHLPLDGELPVAEQRSHELVALDDALRALAALDPAKEKVVELRYFGGLTIEETAAFLNVSADRVKRDWRLAKAWLMRELSGGAAP